MGFVYENEAGEQRLVVSVDQATRLRHVARVRDGHALKHRFILTRRLKIMPKEFQRENRYVVFKRSDMRKYLSQSECKQVEGLALHICLSREGDGKHPLNCLVVESDWPEFEPTWGAIEARVTGAEQPTSHEFDDSATIAGLKSAVSR